MFLFALVPCRDLETLVNRSWWYCLKKESQASVFFPGKTRYSKQYKEHKVSVKLKRQAEEELKHMLKLTLYMLGDNGQVTSPSAEMSTCSSMAEDGWRCLLSSRVSFYHMRLVVLLLLGSQNYFSSFFRTDYVV